MVSTPCLLSAASKCRTLPHLETSSHNRLISSANATVCSRSHIGCNSRDASTVPSRLGVHRSTAQISLGSPTQAWRRRFQEGMWVGEEKRRRTIVAIGFTADPRPSVDRAAARLLRDAASLLVYQEVFKPPPAQAFLRLLLQLRRGDDPLRVLESFGEFYRLMAFEEHSSWEDYLIHRILTAENNPFAEGAAASPSASAAAAAPSSPSVRARLHSAAAVDLSSLQRLCVNESTLSGWVSEVVSDMSAEWKHAAAGNGSEEAATATAAAAAAAAAAATAATAATVAAVSANADVSSSTSSSISSSSEPLPRLLSSLWDWSAAIGALEGFHAANGFGEAAVNSVLQWKAGRFISASPALLLSSLPPSRLLSLHSHRRKALQATVVAHVGGEDAPHVLLHGPPSTGKSTLLRSVLLPMCAPMQTLMSTHGNNHHSSSSSGAVSPRLRVVFLDRSEVKSLAALLEAAGRMPQLRFCVVVDNLSLRSGEDAHVALRQALHSSAPFPPNVQLCVTSLTPDLMRPTTTPATSAVPLSTQPSVSSAPASSSPAVARAKGQGEVGSHFAFALEVDHLTTEQQKQCLAELLLGGGGGGAGVSGTKALSDVDFNKHPGLQKEINSWEGGNESSLLPVVQALKYIC